jgi:hypothetical protein
MEIGYNIAVVYGARHSARIIETIRSVACREGG